MSESASSRRYVQACYAVIFFSLLSHMHVDMPAYNLALGVLGLFGHLSASGAHLLGVLVALFLSFGMDVATLVQILDKDHHSALTIIAVIMFSGAVLCKVGMFLGARSLFSDLGGLWTLSSGIPVEYGSDRASDVSGIGGEVGKDSLLRQDV